MTKFSIKSARGVAVVLVAPTLLLVGLSCTNLTEVPHDALTPENAFTSQASIVAGVAGVYATLRDVEGNGSYESMQDLTTDMSVVPTRGSDWYDNGQWLDIHHQTYTPNSAGTLGLLNGDWNAMFSAVAKENLMLDVVAKSLGSKGDTTAAELRTLRAWDYYMLQDMWGGVPLVTSTELKQYPSVPRDSIFRFLSSELQWAAQRLPTSWPPAFYGRVTKGAANAILASLYINAGVFTKDSKGINPTAYNSCSGVNVTVGSGSESACQAAIDAANAVINEVDPDTKAPVYQLNDNWYQNFSQDNKSSPENIFVIEHVLGPQGLGGSWPMWTLHYNQLTTGWGGPWNGFATTAETFHKYPTTDDRYNMWLHGRAMSFDHPGTPVNDRNGNPLIFTDTIGNLNAASEGEGVRFNKFPPVTGAAASTGQSNPNDFPFFRLTEMYLIRAEAENELGQTGAAIADLAKIHDRHDPSHPVASMGLGSTGSIRDAIRRERLLEFAMEGKRRSDMIRFGTFTTWTEASKNGTSAPRDYHVVLFPVPAPQLASNPLLTQNPGY